MSESITLTTPITKPSQTGIVIDRLTIDVTAKSVTIQWLGNNNEIGSAVYPTPAPVGSLQPTGAVIITTLNTANLTTNSLVKRILQRLQTDGYIGAGNVIGTPD